MAVATRRRGPSLPKDYRYSTVAPHALTEDLQVPPYANPKTSAYPPVEWPLIKECIEASLKGFYYELDNYWIRRVLILEDWATEPPSAELIDYLLRKAHVRDVEYWFPFNRAEMEARKAALEAYYGALEAARFKTT